MHELKTSSFFQLRSLTDTIKTLVTKRQYCDTESIMRQRYFVFECYHGTSLLFRSFGKDAELVEPRPLSDPELRIHQRQAKAAGVKLSYEFIACGLSKDMAERQLRKLNLGSLQAPPIVWHPDSGVKPLKCPCYRGSRKVGNESTTLDSTSQT